MVTHRVWEGVPGRKAIVSIRDGVVKHYWVETAQQIEKYTASRPDDDWYFAPAGFSNDQRKAVCSQGAGAFWLDLDCGANKPFASQTDALQRLGQWLEKRSFPEPSLLISSGNGVHVYWLLREAYARDAWYGVASKLKLLLRTDSFPADETRTADIASIMRLPGTLNHKTSPAKPVTVLHESDARYTLHDIHKLIPKMGPVSVPRPKLDDEFVDPGDPVAVVGGCQQIRDAWGKPEMPEPLWRAALSVLYRCVGGEELVQQFSKGDPRYDPKETLHKAQLTQGPLSCEQFESACPGGCEGCINKGTVRTPIQLKQLPKIADKPKPIVRPETPWPWSRTDVGTLTANGVHVSVKGDDGAEGTEWVCKSPIWVSAFREALRTRDERPWAEVDLSYFRANGTRDVATVEVGVFADNKKFETEIRHMGITGAMKYPPLKTFLSDYMDKHVREIGVEHGIRRMGWLDEGIALGGQVITKTGIKPARILSGASAFKKFTPRGTLDGWKKSMEAINSPRYIAHQFAVLCGFASVLYEPAQMQGAVLVLVGKSGGGKTAAAKAALSIYGPCDALLQNASQATPKGIGGVCSTSHNFPIALDEIGPLINHKNPKLLGDLMYLVTNGSGGASMQRNRDLRDMHPWNLQAIVTSNLSLADIPHTAMLEAQRLRFIELFIHEAMPKAVGSVLMQCEKNAGTAGPIYLQAVCGMREQLPEMLVATEKLLDTKYTVPAEARFIVRSLAMALVGGTIAKSLGLIPFDVEAVIDAVATSSYEQVGQIKTSEDIIDEVIPEWLRRNNAQVVGLLGATSVAQELPTRHPIAAILGDEVFISRQELMMELTMNNVASQSLDAWVKRHEGKVTRAQLSVGTPYVQVIQVPKTAVNL